MTIVAAWISAETGVGPSMASGSHVCSGNCPDLPHAPSSSISPMAVATPLDAWCPPNCGSTPANDVLPK